jgi:hypothetical protein
MQSAPAALSLCPKSRKLHILLNSYVILVEDRVAFDKSEGVVKAQNSGAVFFSPLAAQSWWRTEAL